MLKLLYSPASPYSCKVRIAAAYVGVQLELVTTETTNPAPELIRVNPLGKIPVLLLENGETVFDSRAITHYLDRVSGGRLFPVVADARTRAEVLESLCDGMCDALLAQVYERRFRPESMIYQPWLERQWSKAEAALKILEQSTPALLPLDPGKFALRASLGYLDLRFKGGWEAKVPGLINWAAKFDREFPELVIVPS